MEHEKHEPIDDCDCRDCAVASRNKLRTELTAAQAEIEQMREAFQAFIDEHEECSDADGWMAFMCSPEAKHDADEAIDAIQPTTEVLDAYTKPLKAALKGDGHA